MTFDDWLIGVVLFMGANADLIWTIIIVALIAIVIVMVFWD